MKLSPVTAKYGAQMGRSSYGFDLKCKMYVSRIRLSNDGYETQNPVYWGVGEDLYACSDTPLGDSGQAFATCRAKNRDQAKAKFMDLFPHASFYR